MRVIMRDLTFQRVRGTENGRKDSGDSDAATEGPDGRRTAAREKRDGSQTDSAVLIRGPANVPS